MSIDQFVNTMLGGDPDMTLSARLGRDYRGTFMEKFVDWLFWVQEYDYNHCERADSHESDEGKDAVLR